MLVDDQPVPIGDVSTRALLAMLLLEPNQVVPRDRILDTTGRRVGASYFRLRRLLAEADPTGSVRIEVSLRRGYRIVVDPSLIDVTVARQLLAEAEGAPPKRRRELLDEAASLWQGPSLADLRGMVAAPELDRLRLAIDKSLAEAILELGRHEHGEFMDRHLSSHAAAQALISLYTDATDIGRSLDRDHVAEAARVLRELLGRESQPTELDVTIYLSDEAAHQQVESAVENLVELAGGVIESRDEVVIGSWFRRMRAKVSGNGRAEVAREIAMTATHAAELRLVLAQDATVTATMMQNVGPVITALQPTKDAVVRVGAVLIVKVNWVVTVLQLTAAQQLQLNHQPHLASLPHKILPALTMGFDEVKPEIE
jgi:DNA-binding winged helix-turn-helix (wHTH) protein